MMTSITKAISTSFLALGLMSLACAAGADPQTGRSFEPLVRVHIGGLDTSSAEGSHILYERIAEAARTVCSSGADWYPRVQWSEKNCYRATLDHTVAKLNLPALTAVHLARTHRAERSIQASNR